MGDAMKRILLAGATVLALTAAQPTLAADAPVYRGPAPYAAALFNWSGFYIGVQLGYGWGQSTHSFNNGAPTDNSAPGGVLAGGHLGVNWQTGALVFGVEGDIEYANLTGSFVNLTGSTSVGSANMTWDGSIRGRLGLAMDRSLLYVTAGWAVAQYNFGGGRAPAPACCGFSANVNGWTAGVGWEYAFANNLTGRIEYRYTDYGSVTGALVPTFPAVLMTVRNTTGALRGGLSYKF